MKTKISTIMSLALSTALLLAACAPGTSAPLEGTSWVLYAIGKTFPIEGTTITIQFEDGSVNGNSGCNQYGGSYVAEGDRLTITQLYMTEMACMEPIGVMEQESNYLEALGNAQRFEIADGQLQIYWSGQEALTFVPR